jgi:hypothetical protein
VLYSIGGYCRVIIAAAAVVCVFTEMKEDVDHQPLPKGHEYNALFENSSIAAK